MPEPNAPASNAGLIPDSGWFNKIIDTATEPIRLFALVILVLLVLTVAALAGGAPTGVTITLIGVLVATLAAFVGILLYDNNRLFRPRERPAADQAPPDGTPEMKTVTPPAERPVEWEQIYGADKPPPDIDGWYRKLRPTLHQASFYTVPTYYLDPELYILDFNVAFELIFGDITGRLRGRHVNWFINKLQNSAAVFDHGIRFTDRVKREGRFPFVDLEPIEYNSPTYGRVSFTKVASQLHDAGGQLQGWAVALMIRSIADWDGFEADLGKRLYQDKLWSVYSGPYDRILTGFQPYRDLIRDVISVVPDPGLCVGDLGAGTGNVSLALLKAGQRVCAVENNVGMLDRLAAKTRGLSNISLVKSSVESLDCFKDAIFDGVVMVNVLYALENPIQCLREVHRLLRPGGVLGFSTTHRETRLDELLEAIRTHVQKADRDGQLRADYDILYRVNREIEKSIACRHTRDDYRSFLDAAGFEVTRFTESTYHNAVMLVHARKR